MGKFADYANDYTPLEHNNLFGDNVQTDYQVSVEDPGGLLSSPGTTQGEITLLDGDTFVDRTGQKYRLSGATAPETAKVKEGPGGWFDDVGRTVEIDPGTPWGQETMQAVNAVMQAGGFNRVIKTGDTSHDRELVKITNDKGEDLTEALYRSGVLRPDKFTEKVFVDIYEAGQAARELGVDTGYAEIVGQLDQVIYNNTLRGETGLIQFGGEAIDEAQLAAIKKQSPYFNLYTDVAFDDPNRTKDNVATNSIGESAYAGWLGMKEGAYGAAELLGESLGIDVASEFGAIGIERTGREKEQLGEIENLDFNDVNGVYDFLQFAANNTAMSVPYLGLIAGGTLLSPLTGGGALGAAVSILPSAAVYSGQVWNEMEGDKNAGAAIAAGVLAASVDRLGLETIAGRAFRPSQLLTQAGRNTAAKALVETGKAATEAEALQMITNVTKREAIKLLQHQAAASTIQAGSLINRTNLVKDAAKSAIVGGFGEALTEATQESVQYVAATQYSDKEFNQWELEDRVRNAMLAAFGPGSGFAVAGSIVNTAGLDAARRNLERASLEQLNQYDQLRERLRVAGHPLQTVDEILEGVRADRVGWEAEQESIRAAELAALEKGKKPRKRSRIGGFARRAKEHQKDKRGFYNTLTNLESFPDAVAKAATGLGKLWNAASVTAFRPEELANENYGQILRDIRALVGQGRGVINPGRSFEGKTDLIYGTLASMLYMPQVLKRFGHGNTLTEASRREMTGLLREYGRDYYEGIKSGEITADQLPDHLKAHAAALLETANELENQSDAIHEVQRKALEVDGDTEGFGKLKGWWWKHQDFDPGKVQKNKTAFYEFLRTHTEMTDEEITDFYDRITGGDATTLTDYFSHVRGIEFEPGHQKAREANLSEQDGFEMFSNDNMFVTLDNAAKSAARFSATREYFGSGGRNLDIMFDRLAEAGMSEDRVNEVAWYTKAIIDSATGNFNRIQNPTWAGVNKFASTWSIFAGLPLSALSSLPESAMVSLGLDGPEASKAISKMGEEMAKAFFKSGANAVDDALVAGNLKKVPEGADYAPAVEQSRLDKAGLFWSPASAGKRLGVGETNISYQWMQDLFFRGIGLTNITQAQRRAAAGITTDFVANRLGELAEAGDLKDLTARQQHIYNQLAEIGIEVDRMIELWKDYGNTDQLLDYAAGERDIPANIMREIDDNMQTAVYNFTNMRIQNPGAANRPLFFQDPHWQLLTQFNGFISTFTANVVPKLWNDYLRRGTPQVKYNTFALMIAMMGMGAASQYMKDYLKYGKITPYLETKGQIQRAIYSSGVLGQAERAVELVAPIYGGQARGTLAAQIWGIAVGEAGPTVRNVGNVLDAAGAIAGGEVERGVQKALKSAPLIAPVTGRRKQVGDFLTSGDIGAFLKDPFE